MRKMATIQEVSKVYPIPGADKIEAVDVLGWTVVSEKGIHSVGDKVVFYEIDSWLSADDPRYDSFKERFSTWGEKTGMRLRTIKLRKQISQGLIMSLKHFPEIKNAKLGDDVTEILKIEKWESEKEQKSNGGAQGVHVVGSKPFPSFIYKTDQERIQNYMHCIPDILNETYEATVKLDGSSMTVFHLTNTSPLFAEALDEIEAKNYKKKSTLGKFWFKLMKKLGRLERPDFINGVCSRNIQLDNDGDNHFSKFVNENNIFEKLESLGYDIAIQGELIGPNIQANYEKVAQNEFYVYDVFDINNKKYLLPGNAQSVTAELKLNYVPVLAKNLDLKYIPGFINDATNPDNSRNAVDAILKFAEGEGLMKGVKREGVVYKSNVSPRSFKAISNSYLVNQKD